LNPLQNSLNEPPSKELVFLRSIKLREKYRLKLLRTHLIFIEIWKKKYQVNIFKYFICNCFNSSTGPGTREHNSHDDFDENDENNEKESDEKEMQSDDDTVYKSNHSCQNLTDKVFKFSKSFFYHNLRKISISLQKQIF